MDEREKPIFTVLRQLEQAQERLRDSDRKLTAIHAIVEYPTSRYTSDSDTKVEQIRKVLELGTLIVPVSAHVPYDPEPDPKPDPDGEF